MLLVLDRVMTRLERRVVEGRRAGEGIRVYGRIGESLYGAGELSM